MFCNEEFSFIPYKNQNKAWCSILGGKYRIFTTFCWMLKLIHKHFYHKDTFTHFFIKSQVPNVQGSSLSPPSALEELNLTLRRLSQVSKVALVSLALKLLICCHFMTWSAHCTQQKSHFTTYVMFNFNSNDRDAWTQSLLTLWSRIDFLDNICSTKYFEVDDQQEVLSSSQSIRKNAESVNRTLDLFSEFLLTYHVI